MKHPTALVLAGLFLIVVYGIVGGGVSASPARQSGAFEPGCPHASYGADGNMAPLFCVVDNPLALRYFKSLTPHLLALGPSANPGQVERALVLDRPKAATLPILCSGYRLAAWRNHWSFGVSPLDEAVTTLHLFQGWCTEPNFSTVSD